MFTTKNLWTLTQVSSWKTTACVTPFWLQCHKERTLAPHSACLSQNLWTLTQVYIMKVPNQDKQSSLPGWKLDKLQNRAHSTASKMVLKVFCLLATLALVGLPLCSATAQQQQQQQGELWDISVCVYWDTWCSYIRATTLHWLILHSWAAVCQQNRLWLCGCKDSCCWEWAQHLAKCHHSHSQKVPAGEPR